MITLQDKKLPREFYQRDTHVVAQELLGKLLVRRWRGRTIAVKINEVESYVGEDDKASHASRGRTPRTAVMYGPAGFAYVYVVYGMHHCLNVVTDTAGFPAAVLIRGAIQTHPLPPLSGRVQNGSPLTRGGGRRPEGFLNGPGKLTRALHITRAQNRLDLTRSDTLYIADDGRTVPARDIIATPRIGVDYAGDHALLLWRYYIDFFPSSEGKSKKG